MKNEKNMRRFEDLSKISSLGIGSPRPVWYPRSIEAFFKIVEDRVVIGRGSNSVFSPEGPEIVRTTELREIRLIGPDVVRADCGVSLQRLIRFGLKHGLGGLEFLASVPGTVGGAVFMNAGRGRSYPGQWVGRFVERVMVCAAGEVRWLEFGELEADFEYRTSLFQRRREITILAVDFKMIPDDPARIQSRVRERMRFAKETQDMSAPNAGSVFKEWPGPASGFRHLRSRDLVQSGKTGNWFLNRGKAEADDFDELVRMIREKLGRELVLEVEIL